MNGIGTGDVKRPNLQEYLRNPARGESRLTKIYSKKAAETGSGAALADYRGTNETLSAPGRNWGYATLALTTAVISNGAVTTGPFVYTAVKATDLTVHLEVDIVPGALSRVILALRVNGIDAATTHYVASGRMVIVAPVSLEAGDTITAEVRAYNGMTSPQTLKVSAGLVRMWAR